MRLRSLTIMLCGALSAGACGRAERRTVAADSTKSGSAGSAVDLTGAGATFPFPIYDKWFHDYAAATSVRVNYQPIGSGGGIKQISEQTVDFGASDGPMSDDEMSRAKGGAILHFPTILGADVVTYNLAGVTTPLRMTGEVIAAIFLGKVRKWNDARIAVINPGVTLPSQDILVVHRSDGSGTTYIFTDYLSTVSSEWEKGPGRGKDVQWPVGLGGKGNEGVAGQVKQTPGTIGYVELAYAQQNHLPAALVRNAAGKFVEPTAESISAAADAAASKLGPDTDYRISIVNAPGETSYPISSFTWLLIYEHPPDATKGKKLVALVRWVYSTGQASAASLGYAPLPQSLSERLVARLTEIKVGSAP
jgi:phosphate transport system substrate-binding protein